MSEILAIAFDKDGTSFDSERLYAQALRASSADFGRLMPDDMLAQFTGLAADLTLPKLDVWFGGQVDLTVFAQRWQAYRDAYIREQGVPLLSGAAEAITLSYDAGYPLALVTSDDLDGTLADFSRVDPNVFPRFSVVITVDDVVHAKPDPEPYLRAAAYLGVDATQMLVVEDSQYGAQAALAAGSPLVIRGGHGVSDDIKQQAIAVIEDVSALRHYL